MSGNPEPLGVLLRRDGINVAVRAPNATAIEFCRFDGPCETRHRLDGRTGDVHHAFLPGIGEGVTYGLRAHGPDGPGHRFNPCKLLVDPWATRLDRAFALHPAMFGGEADSAPFMPKAVVTAGLVPVAATHLTEWPETVIYELHVRGFTARHPDIPADLRGRFAGLAHPAAIAHLKRLGITTVELMPAAAWIEERHLAALGLPNYWGYNPVALLAPDPRLAPGGWPEVRAAIAALAEAGIETILDVVLNHTGEGDEFGPTISLRGLDNATYYRLDPHDPARYIDDAGCGNTIALDRPAPMRLAMDALRQWAAAGLHGFRFDLATTLGRRTQGFDAAAPLLQAIAQEPMLRGLKLIAEPWDIGPGGYQAGNFPPQWAEWNDRFRDTVRRFWRGDAGQVPDLATRLAGSADLFDARHHPSRSLNFVTAHDGFTLADLTTYATRHNGPNGEHNRDGTEANHSWNHGTEGPDPTLSDRRRADQRALLATLILARGTPMIAMGAELGHTQNGNNNAYAQDNETTWLDWAAADQGLIAWTARMIALRRRFTALRADRFLTGTLRGPDQLADVRWLDATAAAMDWDANPATLAMVLAENGIRVTVVLHRGPMPVAMTLPPPRAGHRWRLLADSADPTAPPQDAPSPVATPGSVLVLEEAATSARPPADPALLGRLAGEAGIAPEWWTVDGVRTEVTDDTRRALLAAMRLPAATAGEARDSLRFLAETGPRRPLPRAHLVRQGHPADLALAFDPALPPRAVGLTIDLEDGSHVRWRVEPVHLRHFIAADGYSAVSAQVQLPPLPCGRHIVRRDDAPDAACCVTVAPVACFRPDALATPRFGLATQLYTLRREGDQGIGDFTTLARLAERAAAAGAATVAINPLHMLFPGQRDRASPYFPSDRRFLDPIYLDLPGAPPVAGDAVDYHAVWASKSAILERAFAGFASDDGFTRFIADGGATLRRFAIFQAIAEQHRGPWQTWPDTLRRPDGPGVRSFGDAHADRVRFHQYLQFRTDAAFAAASGKLAIGLMRDLAVGAAPDGAEAWAEQDRLAAGAWIGAPPDPFAPGGQNWGLPPPLPRDLEAAPHDGYARMIAANMRHAGALRIDHVMALARLFWIPEGGGGADGAYVAYPRDALIGQIALESMRAACMVIGEDLGTVPEGLRPALDAAGLFGTRVLLLDHEARSYPSRSVACVSTHDLPPFAGWWAGDDITERMALGLSADSEAGRGADRAALELEGDPLVAAHRRVAESPADLVLVQTDDLIATRSSVNLPGTDTERPNWRRRLAVPVEALLEGDTAQTILATMGDRHLL